MMISKKNAPKAISGDRLIEKLSDFASNRNVQILSFSPAEEKSNNFVSLTSVEVNIASERYADIILFMNDIESSPYTMRIGRWNGTYVKSESNLRSRSQRLRHQGDVGTVTEKAYIKATIRIELVELKNV